LLYKIISLSYYDDINIGLKVRLMLFASMFDDIIVPVFAFMCVDPSCFLAYFSPPDPETTTYSIERCDLIYNSTGLCLKGYVEQYETEYQPLFIYNYQCGTSVVKAFVPVIIFSNCFSSLISFTVVCLAHWKINWEDYLKTNWIANSILPELLAPRNYLNIEQQTPANKNILESEELLVVLYQHIMVLLTFGVCAPYVAFMSVVSASLYTLRYIFCISRFINNGVFSLVKDVDNALPDQLEAAKNLSMQYLNSNSTDIVADSYYDWCAFMIFMCGAMVSLLLVDMAADENTDPHATNHFIFLVMPLLFAITGEYIRRKYYHSLEESETTLNPTRKTIVRVEMNPIQDLN
jgi:hypothetical protein